MTPPRISRMQRGRRTLNVRNHRASPTIAVAPVQIPIPRPPFHIIIIVMNRHRLANLQVPARLPKVELGGDGNRKVVRHALVKGLTLLRDGVVVVLGVMLLVLTDGVAPDRGLIPRIVVFFGVLVGGHGERAVGTDIPRGDAILPVAKHNTRNHVEHPESDGQNPRREDESPDWQAQIVDAVRRLDQICHDATTRDHQG